MPSTYAPPTSADIEDVLGGYFLPSRCPRCPASGYGPACDPYEDPHTLTWRRGAKRVTCEYECRSCGHTWTERWRPVWLFGVETL
ncbi:hypothetical protein [Nocardia cyriacigeorgica]|uniref:hypothetical protein n=1 Tax=Nocardia cyriacigeorgica TaxID=135487 RepID=UPI002457BB31|nr:hypothetical protein [Nocardia cyriacigeorgica]